MSAPVATPSRHFGSDQPNLVVLFLAPNNKQMSLLFQLLVYQEDLLEADGAGNIGGSWLLG